MTRCQDRGLALYEIAFVLAIAGLLLTGALKSREGVAVRPAPACVGADAAPWLATPAAGPSHVCRER